MPQPFSTATLQHTARFPLSYKLRPCWEVVVARSHFKPETSFELLSQGYTGQCTCFCKT